MKRVLGVLLFALTTLATYGQSLAITGGGVAVAHDGRVELFDRNATPVWSVPGVANAGRVLARDGRIVVLDPLANEALVIDEKSGEAIRWRTGETPVDAVFAGPELYVLARDARLLQRFRGAELQLPPDPAFLASDGERVWAYARSGVLAEISGDRIVRTLAVPPAASDLEIAGSRAYLVYPRDGRVRIFDLASMAPAGEIAVGAVPVDLAFAGGGSAITARILAVADPSAKRVWMTESTQSTAKATARGFLRGLLGLGLFTKRGSQFPTGVDRVLYEGGSHVAFDSSGGTLYRFTGRNATVLATDIAPGAFGVTSETVYWWDGRLRMSR
jgi:hypothetical protein